MRRQKILIMGLPKSGKTTLAKKLAGPLGAVCLNEDTVSGIFNDSKNSNSIAHRLKTLAILSSSYHVIVDFNACLHEQQDTIEADYVIWLDTIKGEIDRPKQYNIRVTDYSGLWVEKILKDLI